MTGKSGENWIAGYLSGDDGMEAFAVAKMSVAELTAYVDREFPQIHEGGRHFAIEAVSRQSARVRMAYAARFLRPGGAISGPAMFTLADFTMYIAVLAAIGPAPLAVTTNLTINFLRKPAKRDMLAEARLLKLGKRLAVGEIALTSDGHAGLAAHATATYSIPPGALR